MKIPASPEVLVVLKQSHTFGLYMYARTIKITLKLERYVVRHVNTANYRSLSVKIKPKA
jgi:hypothetical protein